MRDVIPAFKQLTALQLGTWTVTVADLENEHHAGQGVSGHTCVCNKWAMLTIASKETSSGTISDMVAIMKN